MNKQQYLTRTYETLKTLINDPKLKFDLAQVRARAIQEEFVPDEPTIQFSFDSKSVWRYCDYIFTESNRLLREDIGSKNELLGWIKNVAQNFEFLAKFAVPDDRELLLMNAAMCYYIAGYQANALCLAKIVEREFGHLAGNAQTGSPDQTLASLFRASFIKLLQHNVASLGEVTSNAISNIQALQERVTEGVSDRSLPFEELINLTAHAFFQQSLKDFVEFCLEGNVEQFSSALHNIKKSYTYFQQVGDVRFSAITSELRTLFDLFTERSTWSIISRNAERLMNDSEWQFYLRYLAFDKSIIEFWVSQIRAIENGLLTSRKSLVVQMPTSAGKTFIAELAILAALTQQQGTRCLYIAPYRALVNEVEDRLAENLGALGFQVSNLIGGFETDLFQDFLARESDVLVATPEKVDLFLRTNPEYFTNIAVIVIDEGHIVDEGLPGPAEMDRDETLLDHMQEQGTLGRGVLLELLVSRLKRKLPDAQFLFMSAVMPEINAKDFVTWLSSNQDEPLRVSREERPSRQVFATFHWNKGAESRGGWNGQLEYIDLPVLPNGKPPFVPYFLERKQYFTGDLTPSGKVRRQTWPDPKNKSQTTALLAARCARSGPVLVFCATPKEVRDVTSNVITALQYLEASDQLPSSTLRHTDNPDLESYHLAMQWLGEEHPLTQGLRRGVGLHFGPLPDPVRQAVEDDFKRGRLQILVSTNTLGQGVNLPIKTAIIYSLVRRYPEMNRDGTYATDRYGNQIMAAKPIRRRDFWNICGRAGRAGKETEGHIIFVVSSNTDAVLMEEYKDASKLEAQGSALFRLLQALVEARISQDDLVGYLDSHSLALLVEEVVDTADEDRIKNFLGTSLVGIQAARVGVDIEPLVAAIGQVQAWVASNVAEPGLQKVFAATGLRVQSCRVLEAAVDDFLESTSSHTLDTLKNVLLCDEQLLEVAFRACANLPELRLARSIRYGGSDDEFRLVRDWVFGKSIGDMYSEHWQNSPREAFSEYVADRLIYKLPWGFNGFLQILAYKLTLTYEQLPLPWQNLPLMVKFGVHRVIACWVSSIGISSRQVVLKLAEDCPLDSPSFFDFLKWMSNIPIDYVRAELNVSRFEKQRLLDKVNNLIPDRSLLFEIASKKTNAWVEGIAYQGRNITASTVRVGDEVSLDLDKDNVLEPNALRVMFKGRHIGYIQRDKGKLILREIRLGRKIRSTVKDVQLPSPSSPLTAIQLEIRVEST